jgi:hypothetical protein
MAPRVTKRWESKFARFVWAYGIKNLAAGLDVDPSAITHWIRGRNTPRPQHAEIIQRLARARGRRLTFDDIYRHSREVRAREAALLANTDRTQATFSDLLEAYIRGHVMLHANNRWSAGRGLRRIAKKYFSTWSTRRIDSIRTDDVLALRDGVGHEHGYQANRLVEMVNAIFSWSAGQSDGKVNFWPVENPARDVELYPEEKRK